MKSYSTDRGGFSVWMLDNLKLFKVLATSGCNIRDSEAKFVEYSKIFSRHSQKELKDSKILEIGFGAKPMQLAFNSSKCEEFLGIDADLCLLPNDSLKKYWQIFKENGWRRLCRTLVRFIFFDRATYRANGLLNVVKTDEFKMRLFTYTFGGKQDWPFELSDIDFIYSEDVFEHIPPLMISNGLELLASKIGLNCILFVRPNIFTGLTGGHDPDYYDFDINPDKKRKFRPWEHLYPENRLRTSTYLNQLRYSEYIELFEKDFEILETIFSETKLGFCLDFQEVLNVVSIDENELFLNQVGFVLRKR